MQIPSVGSISIPAYTWNRPQTMTFPGGAQRTYTYDALMRLESLAATAPDNTPIMNYGYPEYDEVGNILTKVTEHGNYSYNYDAVSRLLSADNPVLDDENYTYDEVGNRLTSADVSGSWSYNTNNELLGYADVEYTYDANGNMTQKRVGTAAVNYIYDAANRLVKVEDDATQTVIAEYYYDPFGRRLWKDVGGVRTYFFYSEEGLIAEYDASGAEIKTYGYKSDSTWTTDPLWLKEGGTYYWYQNDHLGTPQKLTAQDGTVVWSTQYTAFGETVVAVETIANNLQFPGQYADDETGLHYNFHRYYDPKIGRYLKTDPLGVTVESNLFIYVKNRPINYFDDLGLKIKGRLIVRGHVSDGIYGWDYQYRQEGCSVIIRIKLVDKTPYYLNDAIINTWRFSDTIIKAWEAGIEEKWSHKFACCAPDGFAPDGTCCQGYCIITVDVQFVTSGEDAIVYVHHGTSSEYPGHPCLTDMSNWCTTDTGHTAAHEIGHHLGLKDEYLDPRVTNRYPINTGTVMDDSRGPAILRHFREICRNVGKVSTTLRIPDFTIE